MLADEDYERNITAGSGVLQVERCLFGLIAGMEPGSELKENDMKKILFAAAALGLMAVAGAGTASAARWDNPMQSINQQERDIAFRIDRGVRNHALTARETRYLRDQLNGIERLEARYRRDGLSRWEVQDLQRRLDVLSTRVRQEVRDNDWRGDRHPDRRGY